MGDEESWCCLCLLLNLILIVTLYSEFIWTLGAFFFYLDRSNIQGKRENNIGNVNLTFFMILTCKAMHETGESSPYPAVCCYIRGVFNQGVLSFSLIKPFIAPLSGIGQLIYMITYWNMMHYFYAGENILNASFYHVLKIIFPSPE